MIQSRVLHLLRDGARHRSIFFRVQMPLRGCIAIVYENGSRIPHSSFLGPLFGGEDKLRFFHTQHVIR